MQRIFLFVVTNLSVLLLLGLVASVCEHAFHMPLAPGGAGGLLLFAAVFGCGGALLSLALSKGSAKRLMGVRLVGRPQSEAEEWLLATVARLAAQARIAAPEVGVFNAAEMNAFATGARRDAALVAVSTGLLQGMPRCQAEAVLGHEISHVANGDMVTLALLQGVLNTFVIFFARLVGGMVDRAVFKNDRPESGLGFAAASMVAQFLLGLGASLLVAWYSRQRELRADRGGAALAGTASMIAALESLKRAAGEPLPPPLRVFGIGGGPGAWSKWLMSHPPLDARIAALRCSLPT